MESKEEFKRLAYENACCHCQFFINNECYSPYNTCVWYLIQKDLDRLEKYDKAKEIIKKKKVSVTYILYLSKAYVKELQLDVYNSQFIDNITQEEFNLIVEAFGNVQNN